MRPTPPGWPRISAAVFYDDPRAAIAWLCEAFGFSVRILVDGPDGGVEHSELEYDGGLIMVSGVGAKPDRPQQTWRERLTTPGRQGGKITGNLCVHVEDVDAHCARARAAGAEIVHEPETTDYGEDYWTDRSYGAVDPGGHLWWFMQRLRTGAKESKARGG